MTRRPVLSPDVAFKTRVKAHLHAAVDALVEPHAELEPADAMMLDCAFVTLIRLGRLVGATSEVTPQADEAEHELRGRA